MAWLICHLILIFWARDPAALLSAIGIHEAGHMLCALFLSGELPAVRVNGGGIKLIYVSLYSPFRRAAVSLAGPAASFVFALFLCRWESFSLYSAALGAINLFPVSVLDGGNILQAVCEGTLKPSVAQGICRCASVVSTLVIFALNCAVQLKYGTNLSLAAVTVYMTVVVLGKDI